MKTIILFSPDEDFFNKMRQSLEAFDVACRWMQDHVWYPSKRELLQADGVVVDERDEGFSRRDDVDDLELELIKRPKLQCWFVLRENDRHLDRSSSTKPHIVVFSEVVDSTFPSREHFEGWLSRLCQLQESLV